MWDASSGQELKRLEGHTDSVHSVAFSHDGDLALLISLCKCGTHLVVRS